MSELRSWFLRNVLEAAERQLGAVAIANLRAHLPPRLSPHASLERLRASTALDTVPLEEGMEIVLALDALLGDSSGKLLESIGADLTTRMLSQAGSVARSGDLAGTMARLQAFLEHPFVGVPLLFELRRNPSGLSLSIGVTGHSRATRAMRHLTIGTIVAAERFARQLGAQALNISTENSADRSTINARYLQTGDAPALELPPPSRRSLPSRPPLPSLSAEVERILGSSLPPRIPSDQRRLSSQPVSPVRQSGSTRPSAGQGSGRPPSDPKRKPSPRATNVSRTRSSEPPPRTILPRPLERDEPDPPESTTLRVGNVPATNRGPAIK